MEPLTCVSGNDVLGDSRGRVVSGFNGAAHLRERKRQLARGVRVRAGRASMEPLTCVSGNLTDVTAKYRNNTLQWSRSPA